jgi:hypothetical protein
MAAIIYTKTNAHERCITIPCSNFLKYKKNDNRSDTGDELSNASKRTASQNFPQ